MKSAHEISDLVAGIRDPCGGGIIGTGVVLKVGNLITDMGVIGILSVALGSAAHGEIGFPAVLVCHNIDKSLFCRAEIGDIDILVIGDKVESTERRILSQKSWQTDKKMISYPKRM